MQQRYCCRAEARERPPNSPLALPFHLYLVSYNDPRLHAPVIPHAALKVALHQEFLEGGVFGQAEGCRSRHRSSLSGCGCSSAS